MQLPQIASRHTCTLKKSLSDTFQRRIIVVLETIKPDNAIATTLECGGDVGSYESDSAGGKHRDPIASAHFGRCLDLFFPGRTGPTVGP